MTDRTAKVSEAGASVFLTPEELRDAGINPTEEHQLSYVLEGNSIQLKPEGDA